MLGGIGPIRGPCRTWPCVATGPSSQDGAKGAAGELSLNRINTLTAILIGTFCLAMPARAETSVGVSIGIYQPGVYGRIDLGNYPQPTVVYRQPVLIAPQPVVLAPQPVYLYVPSGHRRNWTRYCGQYGACGQPVYFVQERWVRERYEAQRHRGQGKGHGNNKNKRHDD
jgi:hypothetical protein